MTSTDSREATEAHLLEAADRFLMGNYRPARMVLHRGQGCALFDTEGRRYLDFVAGVAVCNLGHGHPALVEALQRQSERLMHVSNYFYNEANVLLAKELCELTGFDRAFFCNSGTEANEAALKLARRWFHEGGEPRTRVIAFHRAFHGRTMGALALTGNPKYLEGFGEPLGGVEHFGYGDLAAVERAMGPDVAAIFVEPVQGEGGVIVPPADFLPGLRRLCDEHGAMLVVDEVQSGMGRTGKILAHEHFGVEADVVPLAKGLGGGFPIGALLVREKYAGGLPPGAHGTTYGGNALASEVARTVLRVLRDEGLAERAAERGRYLGRALGQLAEAHPDVCEGERGLGLMRALAMHPRFEARPTLAVVRDHGLLVAAAGPHALRFIPPLVVTEAEIDEAIERLGRALTDVAQRVLPTS